MSTFIDQFEAWWNKLFGGEKSGQTAKERLKVVLVQDRGGGLSEDVLDGLKKELVTVIAKYLEISETDMEISFNNKDNSYAVAVNIPVTSIPKRNRKKQPAKSAAK
ncbi:MAG: cell division topological specificity factor MinE [Negativicutes bacterium]|nr:cell division topological specificity factor MinE [Negativicutes bacterium]